MENKIKFTFLLVQREVKKKILGKIYNKNKN